MNSRQPKTGNFAEQVRTLQEGRTNRGANFDYMFGIYRYDKDCKKLFPSPCNALPYLHCAVVLDKQDDGQYIYAYVIYVWDKRKALYKFERKVDAETARNIKATLRKEYLLQARDRLTKVEEQPVIFDNYMK